MSSQICRTVRRRLCTAVEQKWLQLPPFEQPRASALAISSAVSGVCHNTEPCTARQWVRRCCPKLPESLLQKLFRQRKVRKHNGSEQTDLAGSNASNMPFRKVSAKYAVMPGDVLCVPVLTPKPGVERSDNSNDEIYDGDYNEEGISFLRSLELYKDEAIIVVNKPHGLPVQGGSGIKYSIDALVAKHMKDSHSEPPRLVHRLDKECSGVLVLGRSQLSTSILHSILHERTKDASVSKNPYRLLERKYLALVAGTPKHLKGVISKPLAKIILQDGKSERVTIAHGGESYSTIQGAVTEYRVVASSSHGFTWLELFPRTGRKHQLRVHCAEVLGTPIVGDFKYGWKAHREWEPVPFPPTFDREKLKKGKKLPYGLDLGSGSIAEKQPRLHLHCKQMMLPNIASAMQLVQNMQSLDDHRELSKLERLNFVAPLPLHMQLSHEILQHSLRHQDPPPACF